MFDKQDQPEPEVAPELVAVESQLRELTPAALRLDRDRFMFEAGRVSERGKGPIAATLRVAGPHWFWPATTALMTAASLLLATMLVWQNRTGSLAQQIANPQAARDTNVAVHKVNAIQADEFASSDSWPTTPAPSSGYLGIRYIALTRGVGALPSDVSSVSGERHTPSNDENIRPATARGLLDEMLPATGRTNRSRS